MDWNYAVNCPRCSQTITWLQRGQTGATCTTCHWYFEVVWRNGAPVVERQIIVNAARRQVAEPSAEQALEFFRRALEIAPAEFAALVVKVAAGK